MSVLMQKAMLPDASADREPFGDDAGTHAWKPAKPGEAESVLQTMSGWSGIAVPFMVQNIGWFVSGFLLVAGSFFVVACTKGFAGNLVTAIFLFCYTLLLIAGAWHLKRRRPELHTVARVLVTVAMLLMPLSIAASARLIEAYSPPALIAGILLAVFNLLIFFPAGRLASGIFDSRLHGIHSSFFVSLSAVQLAAPLIGHISAWPLLAVAHLTLLGITAYGASRLPGDWLKSVFLEKRETAYYAAGLILYAVTVSFIHLTWRYDSQLPEGYFGPFLMLLAGLLFKLDARIKKWTKRNVFLTCSSFAVYGISAAAMAISFNAPEARIATLALGVGVYANVMRRYLTPAPLYMLLGCLGWLYGSLILCRVPWSGYLIAGLPGLSVLFAIYGWTAKREARKLSTICFRILTVLFVSLTVWSLIHAGPGPVGTVTCLLVGGVVYHVLRYSSRVFFTGLGLSPDIIAKTTGGETDLRNTHWFYAMPLVSTAFLAYLPVFLPDGGLMQFATGLTILAFASVLAGTKHFQDRDEKSEIRASLFFNSALAGVLTAFAATAAAGPAWDSASLHFVAFLSGCVIGWLGLMFRLRSLVCCSIVLVGIAAKLIRNAWFPGIPMGVSTMLAAFAAWTVLWLISLKDRPAMPRIPAPDFKLAWRCRAGKRSASETVRSPLEFALPLLWAFSLYRLLSHALMFGPTPKLTIAVGFCAIITGLFAVSWRLTNLSPVPLLLSLGAWLAMFFNLGIRDTGGLGFVAILWSLSAWPIVKRAQSGPFFPRLVNSFRFREGTSEKGLFERRTRETADAVAIFAVAASVGAWFLSRSQAALLVPLAGMFYFGLTGLHYRKQINSYAVLVAASLSAPMIFAHAVSFSNRQMLHSERIGILLAASGFFAFGLAQMADRFGKKADFSSGLYQKPLRVTTIALSLFGAAQMLLTIRLHESADPFVFPCLLTAATGMLAGNHRLKNRIVMQLGTFLAALSVFWIASFLLRGESFALLPASGGQWLTMALIGFLLSGLAVKTKKSANWRDYAAPLQGVALVAWISGMAKIVPAFIFAVQGNVTEYFVPLLFAVQAATLFPLSRTFGKSSQIRGIGIPVLLTGLVMTIPAVSGWIPYVQTAWAFALLGLCDFALPALNRRVPELNADSKTWPWLGLILVAARFPMEVKSVFLQWHYWLCLSIYLFLMLRACSLKVLYWLAAGALSCSAVLSVAEICAVLQIRGASEIAVGALTWVAVLPFLIPVANKHGGSLVEKKEWKKFDPALPFLGFGLLLTLISLAQAAFLAKTRTLPMPSVFFEAALISLCFFHLSKLRNNLLYANGLILSVLFGTIAAWQDVSPGLSHLPFAGALLCGALFAADVFWDRKQWRQKNTTALRRSLHAWKMLSPWPVLLGLLIVPTASFPETLATLAILTGIVGTLGFRHGNGGLISASRVLGLVLLHVWPFVFLPSGKTEGLVLWHIWPVICAQFERLQKIFPWYALQLAILAWVVTGIRRRVSGSPKETPVTKMFGNLSLEITLALAAWAMHFIAFVQNAETVPRIQNVAAVSAACLLTGLGIRAAINAKKGVWVYGTAFLGGLMLAYLRLAFLDQTVPGIWDSAAIIGAACGLALLHRFVRNENLSVPLYRIAVFLPIPAVFFMHLDFAEPAPAGLLLATGAFYLSMRHATGKSLPLYLGVLAINGAIYLWVPAWANRYDLIQLYAVPAALTMLALLHLHRNEIRRDVLNNTRLAAICILYAGAVMDVFQRPEFWVFGLAFCLALAGILLGTALRIRAFLFGGAVFLVMNVLWQMIRFYPEEGLNKGILLMASGAIMMTGMIWFNLKKKSILKRVGIFRSDLKNWE